MPLPLPPARAPTAPDDAVRPPIPGTLTETETEALADSDIEALSLTDVIVVLDPGTIAGPSRISPSCTISSVSIAISLLLAFRPGP